MKKLRKSHIQLLEVLIGISLLFLCLFPIFESYTHIYLSEIKAAKRDKEIHLVHLLHGKLIEQMHQNNRSLQELISGFQAPIDSSIASEEFMNQLKLLNLEAHYSLKVEKPIKVDPEKTNKLILKSEIVITDLKEQRKSIYPYLIYAEHPIIHASNEDDDSSMDPLEESNSNEDVDEEE